MENLIQQNPFLHVLDLGDQIFSSMSFTAVIVMLLPVLLKINKCYKFGAIKKKIPVECYYLINFIVCISFQAEKISNAEKCFNLHYHVSH